MKFLEYKELNEKGSKESNQYNESYESKNLLDSKRSYDRRPLDTCSVSEWGSPNRNMMISTFNMPDGPTNTCRDEYINPIASQLRSPKFLEAPLEFHSYAIQTELYNKLENISDKTNILLTENDDNVINEFQNSRNIIEDQYFFIINNNNMNMKINTPIEIGMNANALKKKLLTEILEEDSTNKNTELYTDIKKMHDTSLKIQGISLTNERQLTKDRHTIKETSISTLLLEKSIISKDYAILSQETNDSGVNKNAAKLKNCFIPLSNYYFQSLSSLIYYRKRIRKAKLSFKRIQ